jgi:hypothetical protein
MRERVNSVGRALLGGKGAACAEMVDRATKPVQIAMMTRINVPSYDPVALSRIAERFLGAFGK